MRRRRRACRSGLARRRSFTTLPSGERYPFGGACSLRPEPGEGDDALCSRPGAVVAFERDPGAVEEEPGGVAFECVELPFVAVGVVVGAGVEAVGVTVDEALGVPACVWAVLPPCPALPPVPCVGPRCVAALPWPLLVSVSSRVALRRLAALGPLPRWMAGVAVAAPGRALRVIPVRVTRWPG